MSRGLPNDRTADSPEVSGGRGRGSETVLATDTLYCIINDLQTAPTVCSRTACGPGVWQGLAWVSGTGSLKSLPSRCHLELI